MLSTDLYRKFGYTNGLVGWFMVNNISVISWRSVLLVEETGVPGENHRPVVSSSPRLGGIRTHNVSGDRH